MELDQSKNKESFLRRNWKIALVIGGIAVLLVLFIIFSGKNVVSPDLVYFPT